MPDPNPRQPFEVVRPSQNVPSSQKCPHFAYVYRSVFWSIRYITYTRRTQTHIHKNIQHQNHSIQFFDCLQQTKSMEDQHEKEQSVIHYKWIWCNWNNVRPRVERSHHSHCFCCNFPKTAMYNWLYCFNNCFNQKLMNSLWTTIGSLRWVVFKI